MSDWHSTGGRPVVFYAYCQITVVNIYTLLPANIKPIFTKYAKISQILDISIDMVHNEYSVLYYNLLEVQELVSSPVLLAASSSSQYVLHLHKLPLK